MLEYGTVDAMFSMRNHYCYCYFDLIKVTAIIIIVAFGCRLLRPMTTISQIKHNFKLLLSLFVALHILFFSVPSSVKWKIVIQIRLPPDAHCRLHIIIIIK